MSVATDAEAQEFLRQAKQYAQEHPKTLAYDKPEVQLSGEDGNVYLIIGRVVKALTHLGDPKSDERQAGIEAGKEFQDRAFASESYDQVLELCFEYVEVL